MSNNCVSLEVPVRRGRSGGFSFGQTTAPVSAAPSTGFSFGQTSAPGTAAPSTGFTFGQTTTPGTSTGSTGFNFGTATTTVGGSLFGSPFGTTSTQPTSSGTGFGFLSNFGGGGPKPTPFGLGGLGGFTNTVPGTGSFNFGTTTNQQAKPAFGFGTGTATGNTSSGFLFGSPGFGAKPATGFGVQTSDAAQQLALQQAVASGQPDAALALHLAICTPSYFNNENDEVLRKWNQLQAFWGVGKGYYAPNMPPVEFTPENPYCRFKVVCYAKFPNYHNEDGIISITIGKPLADVEPHKQQITSTLAPVFGGAAVIIQDLFAAEVPDKTILRIYVQQQQPNGEKQRAAATDVFRHITQPAHAQMLKNLCVQDVIPLLSLTETQLKDYLDTPQRGIDPALWEQGKRENPNPKKYYPVVKAGFQELQKKFKDQEQHAKVLQTNINDIMDEISELKHKQTMINAAIKSAKWKQTTLARRILKLVSAQEVERKRGIPLDQTEEQICMRLEDLYAQLMQPTQYRGCVNELMAQISVKPARVNGGTRYGLVGDKEKEISQYVAWQHNALQAVVNVLKEDLHIVDKMAEEVQRRP